MENENKIETLNMLYSVYNHIENTKNITIYEAYLKKAIANTISIIRNNYLMVKPSLTRFYSYRLIIESLVIMKQYKSDDSIESYDFLKSYNFYLDRSYILNDCLGDGLDFFYKTDSCLYNEIYVNLIKNDTGRYLYLIENNFPFLKKNFSYLKLIDEFYKDLYELYYELKILTEVGSNDAKILAISAIDKDLIKKCDDKIIKPLISITKEYYESNNIEPIKKYDSDFYILNTDLKEKYYNHQISISKTIKDIANAFEDWDDLFEFKSTLIVMSEMLEDIIYDLVDECYEVFVSKLKLIYETLAINYYSIAGDMLTSELLGFMECNKQKFTYLRFKKYKYLTKKGNDLKEFNKEVKFYKEMYTLNNSRINLNNPLYFYNIKGITMAHIIDEYLYSLQEANIGDYLYCSYMLSCRLQTYGYLLDKESVKNNALNSCLSDVLTYYLIINYINIFSNNASFQGPSLIKCLSKLAPFLENIETDLQKSNEILIKYCEGNI